MSLGNKFFASKPNEKITDLCVTSDIKKIKMDDSVAFYKSLYRRILGDISPHADYITCVRKLVEQVGSGVAYIPADRILDMKQYELAMARKRADDLFVIEQARIKEENEQKTKDNIIKRDIELREKAIEEELRKRAEARKRRTDATEQLRSYREQRRFENIRDERILAAKENYREGVTANPVPKPVVTDTSTSTTRKRRTGTTQPSDTDLKQWNSWMEE
jgi:hypothetical protein